jgi:hypothetical protein
MLPEDVIAPLLPDVLLVPVPAVLPLLSLGEVVEVPQAAKRPRVVTSAKEVR